MGRRRGAIYARYSSDLQRSESIDAQIRAGKYYAQRFDIDIVRIYTDAAKSGRTTQKRDDFARMMAESKEDIFDVLLVHKLSRFSRKGTDTLNNKEALERAGVELVSVTERLDNTPEGRLMLYVITGMNEFYSANLANETKKGLLENAYNGKHTGGLPPLGYNVDPETKHLVINETEAEAVQLIFSMYLASAGYGEIVDTLNSRGYRTKRGALFGRNSIHDILLNEKYTGLLTYDKIATRTPDGKMNRRKFKASYVKNEGGCPCIIPKEDFERVKATMEGKRRASTTAIENYLLSGKLFCGECGARMCGERHKVRDTAYSYYVCNEGKRRKDHRLSVSKEAVEDLVFDTLNSMVLSDVSVEAIAKAAVQSYETVADAEAKIKSDIADCEAKISNLVKAIASGLDVPEIRDEMSTLKQRQAELHAMLETILSDAGHKKDLEEWKTYLRQFCDIRLMSEASKKALIVAFVERVLVFQDGPDGGKRKGKFKIEIELNPNHVAGREGNGLPLP